MYQSLDLFQTANAMARHAGSRQALVARNIANADTPGYGARHIVPFSETYRTTSNLAPKATRPGHVQSTHSGSTRIQSAVSGEPAPNGNTVSLEQEMLEGVAIEREHSRAIAIYRHAMTVLRTSLGR